MEVSKTVIEIVTLQPLVLQSPNTFYPPLAGPEGQGEAAQRSVESAATDLMTPSVQDKVYFFTYFPYSGHEGISRLADKLRKKFRKMFLVKELSQSKKIHYHGIGLGGPDINFSLKGYCNNPWHTEVLDGLLDVLPSWDMYSLDPENKNITGEELAQVFEGDKKTIFIKRYLSRQGQVDKMIKYMCKGNPKIMYDEYYLK